MSTLLSIEQQGFFDWSELPVDLLEVVAKELNSIEDLYSFGGVCSSWRCVTLSIRKHISKNLPWLMLNAECKDTHRDFYSVAENKTYRLNYRKAFYNCQYWGSPFGLLLCLNREDESFYLHNPFSPFSPRLTLPSYLKLYDKGHFLGPHTIFKAAVFKLTENIDQFLVFVIYSGYNLAYSKPGDDAWTGITFPEKLRHAQMFRGQVDILHLNGQFYSINHTGSIWLLCDIASGDGGDDTTTNPPTTILYASPPPMWERIKIWERILSLIEMDGELHVAVRYQDFTTRKTLGIEIFKCDDSTRQWKKLETLGDYALFLGAGNSMSLKASDYSTHICKPNHIYFCYEDYFYRYNKSPLPEMGIIDFDRFVVQPLNVEHKFTSHFSAPSWLIPNLL